MFNGPTQRCGTFNPIITERHVDEVADLMPVTFQTRNLQVWKVTGIKYFELLFKRSAI